MTPYQLLESFGLIELKARTCQEHTMIFSFVQQARLACIARKSGNLLILNVFLYFYYLAAAPNYGIFGALDCGIQIRPA
jgi:hypothetical protein